MQSTKLKFQTKDQVTHVYERPDMYVGSPDLREYPEFVANANDFKIVRKTIRSSPAILRIFIEPLSNIIDNVARGKQAKIPTTKISVNIDEKTGETVFYNDGQYIPIELHPEEKCYNHTLIFGQLLSSSNYDDTESREDISGRNGVGVKCTNVFSSSFTVEGLDPVNGLTFSQRWTNNMKTRGEPVIKSTKLKRGFTRITYVPDFKAFGLKSYTEDIIAMYRKCVLDMAMITKVPVYFNDEKVPVSTLAQYASLYNTEPQTDSIIIKSPNMEVLLTPNDSGEFQAISFANGVYTSKGGTHVNAWTEEIFRALLAKINKPKKPQLNISEVKRFFRLFIVGVFDKPRFNDQAKSILEYPTVTAEIKPTQINAICKWAVMDQIRELIQNKEFASLKTIERKKRGYEKVEGLISANFEGTKKSSDCSLILVEGLSAYTYPEKGISVGIGDKSGRDWFGILPLRGKVLNCRNVKETKTIKANKVIEKIIKSIGLEFDMDYTLPESYQRLRYGKVIILADADVDGIHITSLVLNAFHYLFPSLLRREQPFIVSMSTPIVRIKRGKLDDLIFYDQREYEEYFRNHTVKKKDVKYLKGLASSKDADILEDFGKKIVSFISDEKMGITLDKAFSSKQANMRKKWLEEYDPERVCLKWDGIGPEICNLDISDYIDTELIKFSREDCRRSIPSLVDGLKESQRKVLYVCFKENLSYTGQEAKVANLAGTISSKSGYHHGEKNLEDTIKGLGCAFIGSNNIPYLAREGQFGTRNLGGHDAGDGRYIFTKLDRLTRLLFPKVDDSLLDYRQDDGDVIEPEFYVPILPTCLINGSLGIGTGWSSTIPCYNPLDLIEGVRVWLENMDEKTGSFSSRNLPYLHPWYRFHTGEITFDTNKDSYVSHGILTRKTGNTVVVTELPVGLWTHTFRDFLDDLRSEKKIASYTDRGNTIEETILFEIKENDNFECTEETLKLTKSFKTTNMVLFDANGKIKRYETAQDILSDYCAVRYDFYVKRKRRQLTDLESEITQLGNKRRFLEEIRDGIIKLFTVTNGKNQSITDAGLVHVLEERKYDKLNSADEENKSGYEYLLNLQIRSITAERIEKLRNDLAGCIHTRDDLKITSEKEIWLGELDEFRTEYESYLTELENERLINKNAKPKKKAVAKRK